jgi:hypothetical protein
MSINLYHRHFHLFEAVYNKKGQSVKETLSYFQALAKEEGDLIEKAKEWLEVVSKPPSAPISLLEQGV